MWEVSRLMYCIKEESTTKELIIDDMRRRLLEERYAHCKAIQSIDEQLEKLERYRVK